jgi:hypothetical protein
VFSDQAKRATVPEEIRKHAVLAQAFVSLGFDLNHLHDMATAFAEIVAEIDPK